MKSVLLILLLYSSSFAAPTASWCTSRFDAMRVATDGGRLQCRWIDPNPPSQRCRDSGQGCPAPFDASPNYAMFDPATALCTDYMSKSDYYSCADVLLGIVSTSQPAAPTNLTVVTK